MSNHLGYCTQIRLVYDNPEAIKESNLNRFASVFLFLFWIDHEKTMYFRLQRLQILGLSLISN